MGTPFAGHGPDPLEMQLHWALREAGLGTFPEAMPNGFGVDPNSLSVTSGVLCNEERGGSAIGGEIKALANTANSEEIFEHLTFNQLLIRRLVSD